MIKSYHDNQVATHLNLKCTVNMPFNSVGAVMEGGKNSQSRVDSVNGESSMQSCERYNYRCTFFKNAILPRHIEVIMMLLYGNSKL